VKTKGFSLVELIVVIVIFGLFISLNVANFFRQKEAKSLEGALSSTRSFISSLRQSSVVNLVPTSEVITDFKGYGFVTNSTDNKITSRYFDAGGSTNLQPFALSQFKNITLVSPSANTTVYFQKSTGLLLDSLDNPTTVKIILKNSTLDKCSSLSISQKGIITTNENEDCPE